MAYEYYPENAEGQQGETAEGKSGETTVDKPGRTTEGISGKTAGGKSGKTVEPTALVMTGPVPSMPHPPTTTPMAILTSRQSTKYKKRAFQ